MLLEAANERGNCNMSLLGGGEAGRKPMKRSGFQGAVAGASNVKAKAQAQAGSGIINMNKLKNLQAKKKATLESYKLNANGLSRMRLVKPIGNDHVPMMSADAHWLPVVNDEGKTIKRKVYCYSQFGFDFCPICALHDALSAASDQALVADGDILKASNKWAAYIINRDYMAGAEDPIAAHDPRQDKVVLFDNMNPKIADDIIKHLGMRVWGDASDPTHGYDFEIEGTPSGKIFNNYKVSDYALSPIPKDFSPPYDEALLKNMKPLSEIIKYMPRNDLQKIFDPILVSLQQESEEAAAIVAAFSDEYNQMLRAIEAGPEVDTYDEDDQEVIEVNGGEEDAEGQDDTLERGTEGEGEAPNNEIGSESDADGESVEEDAEPGEEIEEPVEESEEEAAPKQTAKPAPSTPTTPNRNAALLGELKNIGKKK